jgi:hypothetical protein
VRVSDRGTDQQNPSGTASLSRKESPNVRVQSLPVSRYELSAWQAGGVHVRPPKTPRRNHFSVGKITTLSILKFESINQIKGINFMDIPPAAERKRCQRSIAFRQHIPSSFFASVCFLGKVHKIFHGARRIEIAAWAMQHEITPVETLAFFVGPSQLAGPYAEKLSKNYSIKPLANIAHFVRDKPDNN